MNRLPRIQRGSEVRPACHRLLVPTGTVPARIVLVLYPKPNLVPGAISLGRTVSLSYPTPIRLVMVSRFSGLFVIGETGLELLSPSRCRDQSALIVDDMEGVRRMLTTYALEDDYKLRLPPMGWRRFQWCCAGTS